MNIEAIKKAIKTTECEIRFWSGKHATANLTKAKSDLELLLDIKKSIEVGDTQIAYMRYNRLSIGVKDEIDFLMSD